MFRNLFLAAVMVVALALPAAAQTAGTYDLRGTSPDGSTYRGTVQLQQTANLRDGARAWRVTWRIDGEVTIGTAISIEGAFVVGYVSERQPGVAMMAIDRNGDIEGVWITGRENRAGTERWIPR